MDEVRGFDSEIYFINNPIWVEIETDGVKLGVDVIHNGKTFNLLFDVYNNIVVFDASIIAKTLMPMPRFDNIYFSQTLDLNFIKNVQFVFTKYDNQNNGTQIAQQAHAFIRGGLIVGNNIPVTDGAELIEAETVPIWAGYPTLFAEVVGTEIEWQSLPPEGLRDVRRVRSCNGIYLAWLNSKGGYSFWLFEAWDINQKSSKSDLLDAYQPTFNYQGFHTTGNSTEYSINVKSIIPKKYFNQIRSLVNSPDVWVLSLEDILDFYGNLSSNYPPINGMVWKRIMNNGNSFSWSSEENQKEVTLSFDIVKSENRQIVW